MTAGLALDCTQKKSPVVDGNSVLQSTPPITRHTPLWRSCTFEKCKQKLFPLELNLHSGPSGGNTTYLKKKKKKRFKLFSSFQNNFSHCLAPAELFAFLCHVWNWISSCLRLLGAGKCNVRESVCNSKYLKYLNKLCMLQLIIALSQFSVVYLHPYS